MRKTCRKVMQLVQRLMVKRAANVLIMTVVANASRAPRVQKARRGRKVVASRMVPARSAAASHMARQIMPTTSFPL
ncbi:hypothetical protein D3C81_2222030 [compost metagenome]